MLHSATLVSREMLERFQEKLLSNSWLAAEIMYIAYKALSSSVYAKVVFLRLHFFPRLKPKSHKEIWIKQCRGPAEQPNLSEMKKNIVVSLSSGTCWVEPGYDKYFECRRSFFRVVIFMKTLEKSPHGECTYLCQNKVLLSQHKAELHTNHWVWGEPRVYLR